VIAESYERIHRANLIEMGVLPLAFRPGEGWKQLGLTGREAFTLRLPAGGSLGPGCPVEVLARAEGGTARTFTVTCRLNSGTELEYYRAGGVLPYVMAHRFAK
jgi:aconitate hydratase